MAWAGNNASDSGMRRREDVVAALRREIVEGRWLPGKRLPARVELLRGLKTTPVTLHHAVQRLVHDGFLRTEPGAGTFVSDRPPHLNAYAVVFVFDPVAPLAKQNWSRYFDALTQAAERLQQASGRRMLVFHGIDQHTDSEDRQRLMVRIERQALAGIIFTNHPFLLEGTSILEAPGIPRVAVMSDPPKRYPDMLTLRTDGDMWVSKALDHLAALGRQRVAVLESSMGERFEVCLEGGLAARGMVSPRRWRQLVGIHTRRGAANAVELLMADRERPDALLIEDDNFVDHALAGLAASGVRVPQDVAVVGHANFPLAPAKTLPLRLLGYDADLLMRSAVELIDRQRRGEMVPRETILPALWEEEVGATKPPAFRSRDLEAGRQAGKPKTGVGVC